MKTIENIPFKCSRWDEEVTPDRLRDARIEVRENEQGKLTLTLFIDGESSMIIANVCPHHYREQVDFLWLGLEQGYDLATGY